MASEDAKTLTQNKKGMLDLLLEQERFNKVETKEGFSILAKDGENRGVSDNMGFLGTKDVIFGNIGVNQGPGLDKGVEDGNGVSVGFETVGESGEGVIGVPCKDSGNRGVYDTIDFLGTGDVIKGNFRDDGDKCSGGEKAEAAGMGVEGESGIRVCSENAGDVGTDYANKGNCGDDGDKWIGVADNRGSLGKELVVDSDKMEIAGSAGSCFSETNLEKTDKDGISLVVELSGDQILAVSDKIEGDKVRNDDAGENVYKVGDFVWGKFNSHPWWPAQIYDPSDASDLARKRRPDGNPLLVAYFGDGTFLWRSPDQLRPFSDNFDELSKKNDSIVFLTSVKDALCEIGRVAELKMCCSCVSEQQKSGLKKEAMVNAGIKKGFTVTQCDYERLPISDFKPLELLAMVKRIAVGDNGINTLELTGIKSCFSAFYRAKSERKLDCYNYEGLVIEGMGDVVYRRSKGAKGSGSVLKKCDKLTDSKKRKSGVKSIVKTSGKKKMKNVGEFTTNRVLSTENVVQAVDENGATFEQDDGELNASRKRKKSKYLSFPFTDPSTSVKMFRSKRDSALETVKISKKNAGVGDKMVAAAAKLDQSSDVLMNNLFENFEIGGDIKLKASPEMVVSRARSAAIDPQSFFESNSTAVVNDFIRAYRKVAYSNGSNIESLSKKSENNTNDEIITLSEMKRETKRNKRVKKNADNNEGLIFIKEKLESLSKKVENCDGVTFAEMKLNWETEISGILEKLNGMLENA